MDILIKITQFLLGLSILIILHEAGHFFSARLFKIKVEKFYLFFDPWFSLIKFKKGDTEYGIGWLPLGGYVKIAGMIDESMDKEAMKLPPQPWEFRSKPAWQRLIVMIAGVTVNVLLAVVIYSMVLFVWGTETLPTKNVKYGIYCDSTAIRMGLRNGDKVVSVDGKYIENFDKIPLDIILDKSHSIQVTRNGQPVNIPITENDISLILLNPAEFIQAQYPCVVDSVPAGSPAEKSGISKGDSIIKIDSSATPSYQAFKAIVVKDSNKDVSLTVVSKGQTKTLSAHVDKEGKIGFYQKNPATFFDLNKNHYSLIGCIPAGIKLAIESLGGYVKQVKIIATVKGATKQVGGFGTILKAYGSVWNWQHFWMLTGFLSIMLAFLNILPIPALDGGHVLFLLYEIITKRKPSDKFLEYAQWVGMILLLSLLVFANGNDIFKYFHK
ncbi:MAG TPA: RIP metalloprotease RseP [Bacteroidia bacterium]|jgi:regulator of sigma E protease|nr:RIP metalloprotease RseP [Bacteroidia bacterium]